MLDFLIVRFLLDAGASRDYQQCACKLSEADATANRALAHTRTLRALAEDFGGELPDHPPPQTLSGPTEVLDQVAPATGRVHGR